MKQISIILFTFILFFFILASTSCKTIFRGAPKPAKFTVSLSSRQVPLGTIEMQRDRRFTTSGLVKEVADILYFPEEDAVCIKYRSDFFTYHLFFDVTGRDLFLKSLEKYRAAYEDRDLPNNNKRTGNQYGSAEGYLIWQELSFTKRYNGNMNIEAGYLFKKNSPYFVIIQNQSYYEDIMNKANNGASQLITLHFTRAQAQELAAFFDRELLRTHAVPRVIREGLTVDVDEY